jgi:hypothetical protein
MTVGGDMRDEQWFEPNVDLVEFFNNYFDHDDMEHHINLRGCHSGFCLGVENIRDVSEYELHHFLFAAMKKCKHKIKSEVKVGKSYKADFVVYNDKMPTHAIELKRGDARGAIGQVFMYDQLLSGGVPGKFVNKIIIAPNVSCDMMAVCERLGIGVINITMFEMDTDGRIGFRRGQQERGGFREMFHWREWEDRDNALLLLAMLREGKIDREKFEEIKAKTHAVLY